MIGEFALVISLMVLVIAFKRFGQIDDTHYGDNQ